VAHEVVVLLGVDEATSEEDDDVTGAVAVVVVVRGPDEGGPMAALVVATASEELVDAPELLAVATVVGWEVRVEEGMVGMETLGPDDGPSDGEIDLDSSIEGLAPVPLDSTSLNVDDS